MIEFNTTKKLSLAANACEREYALISGDVAILSNPILGYVSVWHPSGVMWRIVPGPDMSIDKLMLLIVQESSQRDNRFGAHKVLHIEEYIPSECPSASEIGRAVSQYEGTGGYRK